MGGISKAAAVLAGLCALASAGVARADVMGLWQVPGSAITLRLEPCGLALCGALLNSNGLKAHPDAKDVKNKNPALRTRSLRGILMLQGFKGGPSSWSGGSVYLPNSGETYPATLKLSDPNTLDLKVCVGVFCKTQALKRVN